MRASPSCVTSSAVVIALVVGLATDVIDPTALARALAEVVGDLGGWAYEAVGGMALLETGAFVGLVVPGETVVVVGGVAASHGYVSLPLIALTAWLAAWVGDATSFHLGRRYGRRVIARVARRLRISEQRLSSLERSLARHGGKTVLIERSWAASARSRPSWPAPLECAIVARLLLLRHRRRARAAAEPFPAAT